VPSPDFTDDHTELTSLEAYVPRVRAGDATAYEQLFRALHVSLVTFATRYTGDTARAEELVQDVFFAIWQNRTEWSPNGSVRAYFYGAVRNRALNLRRRDALEQDWVTDTEHEGAEGILMGSVAAGVSDAEQDRADLLARAHAALDALPERCRLVMHLRWREGLSYAEIAETMGIGVKGVENQLARGLKAVRTRLLGG